MRNLENYKAIGEGFTPYAMRNKLINGGFNIWQRGNSFDGLGDKYTADRWKFFDGAGDNGTVVKGTTATGSPFGLVNTLQLECNVATQSYLLAQLTEDAFTFTGSTVTFSSGIRTEQKTATSVQRSVTMRIIRLLKTSDFTWGDTETLHSETITTRNTWDVFQTTFDLAEDVNRKDYYYGVAYMWDTPEVGNVLYVTGAQFEKGSVATPFEQRPIGMELSLCQRYYWRSGTYPHYAFAPRDLRTPTRSYLIITFPTTMRSTPDVTFGTVYGTPLFDQSSTSGARFQTASEVPTMTIIHDITAEAEL